MSTEDPHADDQALADDRVATTPAPASGAVAVPGPGPTPGARLRVPLAWGGAVLAAVLALVWLVVVPEKADTVSGWQEAVIRWGHPLCWALLAVLGVLIAVGAPKRARDLVAVAAVLSYVVFLVGVLL